MAELRSAWNCVQLGTAFSLTMDEERMTMGDHDGDVDAIQA
jgi:hypothetical protein